MIRKIKLLRNLLLIFFLIGTGICNAEWIEVAKTNEGTVIYIEEIQTRRSGDVVTVLEMQDWRESYRNALSVTEIISYNCSGKTRQRKYLTAYSGNLARGKIVGNLGEENPTEVRAGSVSGEVFQLVCNGKSTRQKEPRQTSGSGFFVSSLGHILTNAHVIRKSSNIVVIDSKGNEYQARQLVMDEKLDLALLKIDSSNKIENLRFADFARIEKGHKVYAIGYPNPSIQGLESKITDGIISSLSGLNGESTQMQISTPIQPGNSGGPLVNERGEVVGVVVARLDGIEMLKRSNQLVQNVNYAISGDLALRFVKHHIPDQYRKSPSASLGIADKGTLLIITKQEP